VTTEITVRLATKQDIPAVAYLFDAYRQFYEQAPDFALATTFIGERMAKNESHILLALDGQDRAVGFIRWQSIASPATAESSNSAAAQSNRSRYTRAPAGGTALSGHRQHRRILQTMGSTHEKNSCH